MSLIVNSCDTLVEKLDKVADSGQIRKSALIHEKIFMRKLLLSLKLYGGGKERKKTRRARKSVHL